ncbi:hypothetical protein BDY24DRAFT_200220 [Mrakia frigida]|uniref:uncharacterized protein n=1 Tax=Mrakia frigida TaxID=29902 RepID=UPI003FCBFAAF
MGDIWSYSFRSHIDQDSEDEEEEDMVEKEEGKGGGGEEKKKFMSREEEELSLLDLGGRADESQLVIKETPWTIAASRALPKGDRPPKPTSNPKKTTSNPPPPPPKPSSTSTSLPSKQLPSNHQSTSSHPPSKPKNITVEVNSSPPSSSSSKKRSSGSSSTEIETHTPLPPAQPKLKGDSASTSQSEASGSKKKKKKSSGSSDSVEVVPAKKVTSGGKISFGRIPAGATADSNFPILQAFEHQAKRKPPRVRTPNPPTPPPAAPRPVVVEAPKTSKKLKTLKHRSPLPISYYNPTDRRQPTIKATVPASSPRRSIVENPSPVERRSHTPPRPKGPPTSITSSSPASSNHTFREPPRSRRPLPQRVEVEDDEPFEEAPPPPSSLLPDEEPFSEDQTFEHTPLPPPFAVYYVPGIEPLQQRSPDTHSTHGEDEQLENEPGRGGAVDWSQQRLYDGGEMVQKKRKFGSSKSTEGWKEVGEVQEGAPSRLSSASSTSTSRGGKRRSTFKPLIPFVPPPPPPPPPPQPSFNPPSPRHRQPPPQYEHSAYSHPAFKSDRDDSPPVWSTLPPPKKKKLDPQGVTQLGRFRLPSFVPAPPSSSGSRASLFKRSESPPASSRSSNPSGDPSGRKITLWAPPPPRSPSSSVFAYAPPPMRLKNAAGDFLPGVTTPRDESPSPPPPPPPRRVAAQQGGRSFHQPSSRGWKSNRHQQHHEEYEVQGAEETSGFW